jgi:hypothetical protein
MGKKAAQKGWDNKPDPNTPLFPDTRTIHPRWRTKMAKRREITARNV